MKLHSHRTIIFQSKCVYQELLTEFWQRSNVINYQVPVNVILMLWLWRDKMGHRSLLLFSSVYQNTNIFPAQTIWPIYRPFRQLYNSYLVPTICQQTTKSFQCNCPIHLLCTFLQEGYSFKYPTKWSCS